MKTTRLMSWLGTSVLAKMMARTLVVLTISILIVEWVAYRESSKQIISLTKQQQLSLTQLFAERFDRATERIAGDMQTIRNLPSLEEYYLNRQYDLYGYFAPPSVAYGAPARGRTLGVGVSYTY